MPEDELERQAIDEQFAAMADDPGTLLLTKPWLRSLPKAIGKHFCLANLY
jgi:hypothetical protein